MLYKILSRPYSTIADLEYPGNTKSHLIPQEVVAQQPDIILKLYSDEIVIAPVFLAPKYEFDNIFAQRDIFFGMYAGGHDHHVHL